MGGVGGVGGGGWLAEDEDGLRGCVVHERLRGPAAWLEHAERGFLHESCRLGAITRGALQVAAALDQHAVVRDVDEEIASWPECEEDGTEEPCKELLDPPRGRGVLDMALTRLTVGVELRRSRAKRNEVVVGVGKETRR